MPVISYENLDSAIDLIKSKPKPLSLYLFTNNDVVRKKILNEISFGGGAVNDAVMYFSHSSLPFGGVGQSGMGSYHGKAGFDTFTHYKKRFSETPTGLNSISNTFPHTKQKLKLIKFVMGLK